MEKHIIYNVKKEEYESCIISAENPRIIAYCTEPTIKKYSLPMKLVTIHLICSQCVYDQLPLLLPQAQHCGVLTGQELLLHLHSVPW